MSLRTALSDYGQQLGAEREALVARLCTTLTGAQVRVAAAATALLQPLPYMPSEQRRPTCMPSHPLL